MKYAVALAGILVILLSTSLHARDTRHMLLLEDALGTPAAQDKLDGSVRFYFSGQDVPEITQKLMVVETNKKTNAFGKSDVEACEWVFLSAMLALQERALREGANAVVDITSYYKKNEVASATEYECHAGAIMAGVTFKGRIVKLAE
ncbi:MAG: excinuclease ATPase subunit [Pseudohongiellaceae bacterium]